MNNNNFSITTLIDAFKGLNLLGKIVFGVIGGLLVLSLAYLIFPKSYISMQIAPSSMSVSIDGGQAKPVKLDDTKLVIAGKHTYKFSRDGFADQTVTLTSGNNETKEIVLALKPLTDDARTILLNDSDASHAVQERVSSANEAAASAAIAKNYPIIKILPIDLHSLTITACASKKYPDDPTKIALCVYALDPDVAPDLVDGVLSNKGYKASDYEIMYFQANTNN